MTSHLPYYHESQFGIHPCEKCKSSWRQENNTKIDRYHTKISWCHASHWQQPATGSHDILHTNATAHHNAGHFTNATFQLSLLGGKTTAFFWLMDKRKWASARPITYRLVCGIDGRFVCPSLTMSARVPFLVNLTMQTHMHTCTVAQSFFYIFCCCSCCCCSRCLQIDCDESLSNINIGYTRQTARCWHRMQILFATSHGMCAMQCSTYWPLHAHTVPSPSTQQNTSRIAGIWVYMQLKNHVRTLCKCIYIFFSVAVVFIFDRKSRCKCAASSWLGEG